MKDKMLETATKSEEITDVMSPWAHGTFARKYAFKDENGNPIEDWADVARRVVTNVMAALDYDEYSYEVRRLTELVEQRKFMPGGRYLYATGRPLHQTNNCFLFFAEDSREGWANLSYKIAMTLMTGGGAGTVYSKVRAKGMPIRGTGGEASGPLSLMQIVNEQGRHYMAGGSRRSALIALLHWWHPDVFDFIHVKDWIPEVRALKEKDFNFPAPMDMTNTSVVLDREFFEAYEDSNHPRHQLAHDVYDETIKRMLKTGEPGFSIDYDDPTECGRNPCGEITTSDDSDVCCLGSINLARVESLEEMEELTRLSALFLLAGTVYSDVPFDGVADTRGKNRRLGLGVMGLHEWLAKRGKPYGPDSELASYLEVYARSGDYSDLYADRHLLSRPVKTRAIAPTGTIGILAETTTGIEPIFCVAYKRRYLDGQVWKYQYVVDPTAERLVEQGVDPDQIEDCYTLAMDVERRVAFQAWVQQYVDHGISSTINLAYPMTDPQEVDEFGKMLYRYLPKLRGITVYPDGARGGQPLTVASYYEAVKHPGVVFEENEDRCGGGSCGV
jgi:ribonucleoside-diphosphate reductase alpha chain